MRHPLCTTLSLCISLTLAAPLLAQSADAPQTTLSRPPDHATMLPLTTKVAYTYVQTSPTGATTQKEETVAINDSLGRQSTANTILSTGITTTFVDDPIAGIRFAWNSSTNIASALTYPEPVPGRRSCWRLPAEPAIPSHPEPQLGITGTTCMPAEYPVQQPAYCKSDHLPTSSATAMPEVAINPTSCTSLLQQQPFEDLGTKVVNGFLAHGCRTTALGGSQTNEIWAITLSSATLGAIVQVQGVSESRTPNHQDLKTTQNLTLLQVRQPDPSIFQPPPNYQIKTITMHEVPCGPLP